MKYRLQVASKTSEVIFSNKELTYHCKTAHFLLILLAGLECKLFHLSSLFLLLAFED